MMTADWYVLVESDEFEGHDEVWIHVRDARDFCIEDVRFGVPIDPVSEGYYAHVEERSPRPRVEG